MTKYALKAHSVVIQRSRDLLHESRCFHEFNFELLENAQPTQLLQFLNDLPPASKIVFNLYAIDDFSIKQISETLEISIETVKWHLKTSRKTLRARISNLKTQDHENE